MLKSGLNKKFDIDVRDACLYVTKRLSEELPEKFFYHNLDHTRNVVSSASQLATIESLSIHETRKLLIAAWFHDLGFIEDENKHEVISAEWVSDWLAERNWPEKDIAQIADAILATHRDSDPTNLLSSLLKDADLSHLGGPLFYSFGDALRKEWEQGKSETIDDDTWWMINYRFLRAHDYHSEAGRSLYQKRKETHLRDVEAKIAHLLK